MKKNWYFHHNLKPRGPFSLEEMRAMIHRGEVGPHDLICNEEQEGRWLPALEWGVFEMGLFPATQSYIQGMDVDVDLKEWVLLASDPATGKLHQQGPYSVQEIMELLRQNKAHPAQHVWKTGLSGWSRLQDRPEFQALTLQYL